MAGRSSSDLDHIASEPQSIASLIEGQGDVPLGAVTGGDEDQAALLTYLKSHYADATGSSNPLGTGDLSSLPTTTYRPTPPSGPVERQAHVGDYFQPPGSPINASINIPPTLAALATQSQYSLASFTTDPVSQYITASFDERGEMGGKRRKLPHERAGWKEMDENPAPKKRRSGRKSESGAEGQGGDGPTDAMHQHQPGVDFGVGQDTSTIGAPGGSFDEMAAVGGIPQSINEGEDQGQQSRAYRKAMTEAEYKESRAVQNRRAQQVFRRKREEKMQKLEADAAGYQSARRELAVAQLQRESEHIETMALREALRTLSQGQVGNGVSILDAEGGLVIQPGLHLRQGPDTPDALERAFKTLEAQCRELAKVNRSRQI